MWSFDQDPETGKRTRKVINGVKQPLLPSLQVIKNHMKENMPLDVESFSYLDNFGEYREPEQLLPLMLEYFLEDPLIKKDLRFRKNDEIEICDFGVSC